MTSPLCVRANNSHVMLQAVATPGPGTKVWIGGELSQMQVRMHNVLTEL
jgi:hypothetical protein